MIARRDLLVGGACLLGAGLAYQLKPHRKVRLASDGELAKIIPQSFDGWTSLDGGDGGVIKPETAGTLAAQLYSEIISRAYQNATTGETVMMLVAYGATQSDLLQLHRPEVCYPAFGFNLVSAVSAPIHLTDQVVLPARRVVAEKSDRHESVMYWTRVGEYLPVTGAEQREARMMTAFAGIVPDGGLFRFSMVGMPPERAFVVLDDFLRRMLAKVPAGQRRALLGTKLAQALQNQMKA